MCAVLAAVLIVTAGCAGVPNGGSQTPVDTPASQGESSTPTTDTATPHQGSPAPAATVAERDLPPGVTHDGITNAPALTKTNAGVLAETGYIAELRIDVTRAMSDQPRNVSLQQNVSLRQREVVAKGASRFLFLSQTQGRDRTRVTVWSNGSTTLLRSVQGNRTRYRRIDPGRITSELAAQQILASYLGAGDYTIAGVSRKNGRRLVSLAADDYVRPPGEELPPPENVTRFTSRVVADSEGRIHEMDALLVAERSRGGRTLQTTVTIRYDLVKTGDVRVDRPVWVGHALARVAANSTSG